MQLYCPYTSAEYVVEIQYKRTGRNGLSVEQNKRCDLSYIHL